MAMRRRDARSSRAMRFSASAPGEPRLTKKEALSNAHTQRVYGQSKRNPLSIYNGQLLNPDLVVRQFGQHEGLGIYDRVLRTYSFLSGICDQRIDRANAIQRTIVPGDPNSQISLDMAQDARRVWDRVRGKETILKRLLRGMFTGIAPVEKVWGVDPVTGLAAPMFLYDCPPEAIKFGPNGEEFFLTQFNPLFGERIEPNRFMYFRWGSLFTDYGEGELRNIYPDLYDIQVVTENGIDALGEFSKPTMLVIYPSDYRKEDRNGLKQQCEDQFEKYFMLPAKVNEVTANLLGAEIMTSGGAGRAEFEFVRMKVGHIYIAILGTQQTQDKTSGSRGLEETRNEITDNKTPAASDALDECLTTGWLDDLSAANWANQPVELWPLFKSDTSDISQGITGVQAERALETLLRFSAKQITATAAEELLAALGLPRGRVNRMIASTKDEIEQLQVDLTIAGGGVKKSSSMNEEKEAA